MRTILVGLMAIGLASSLMAQPMGHPHGHMRPQPQDKSAAKPSTEASNSQLPGYATGADSKLEDWAAANDRVKQAGGWKAYAQEIAKDQANRKGSAIPASGPVLTLQAALEQAMDLNPGLRQTIASINVTDENYIRLTAHQREALTQKEKLFASVKEKYFTAVAAQERANYRSTINEAASVAAELALRMRRVGNLNFAHQAEEQLSHAKTAVAWNTAKIKALAAREQLLLQLNRSGSQAEFSLPSRLPELPHHFPETSRLVLGLLSEDGLIAAAAPTSPNSIRVRSQARQALANAEHAYRVARHYRDEVLPLRKKLSEENLLRYNGMLIGVFDLLSDAKHQIEAVEGYLDALQAYWLADAQLSVSIAELKEDGALFRRHAWTR